MFDKMIGNFFSQRAVSSEHTSTNQKHKTALLGKFIMWRNFISECQGDERPTYNIKHPGYLLFLSDEWISRPIYFWLKGIQIWRRSDSLLCLNFIPTKWIKDRQAARLCDLHWKTFNAKKPVWAVWAYRGGMADGWSYVIIYNEAKNERGTGLITSTYYRKIKKCSVGFTI